jgi:hypothetical protein
LQPWLLKNWLLQLFQKCLNMKKFQEN